MKNIFNRMNEENIDMCVDDLKFDSNKIKDLSMKKINQYRIKSILQKSLITAAALACFLVIGGSATYTLAGPEVRYYITELLGVETGEVVLVGETVSSKNYSMTVEDLIYDGVNGKVVLSVSSNSISAKESFATDRIYEKFGHFSIGYSISELDKYKEDNKRFYAISFSKPINQYDHLTSDFKDLIFTFDGIKDMIKIPLEPTIDSAQKNLIIPSQGHYPVKYTSIVYSKIGFTLIGNQVNDNNSYENIAIDFVFKNGDIINFVNMYYPDTAKIKSEPESENQNSSNETVIIDGKKQKVNVSTNNTVSTDVDFISEFDDEWFAGSSGSGYSSTTNLREISFTFQQSFDWESVDKMIINGVTVEFN